MINRFRNAFYGPSGSSDDSQLDLEYKDGDKDTNSARRIRGALTRSSSFREDLVSGVASSRTATTNDEPSNNNTSTSAASAPSRLQRGKSQILRKVPLNIAGETDSTARQEGRKAITNGSATSKSGSRSTAQAKLPKFRYTRPEFLQLRTDDEIIVSADHQIRPIILPRDVSRLPWKSGYAECINAGKSARNEDQAACYQDVAIRQSFLLKDSLSSSLKDQIPWTYFGIFDGHAGTAVAIAAAAQLHNIISEKFRQLADLLIALEFDLEDADEEPDHGDDDDDDRDDNELESDEFTDCSSSPSNSVSQSEQAPPSPRISTTAASAREFNRAHQEQQDSPNSTNEGAADKREQVEKPATEEQPATDCDKTTSCDNGKRSTQQDQGQGQSASAGQPADGDGSKLVSSRGRRDRRQRRRSTLWEAMSLPKLVDICRQNITVDTLIKGALESAFWDMDALIASDKKDYKMAGGCTALVSVFTLGKLYVCNAGDSRAIVYKSDRVLPMSFDFTPTSERERILRLGLERPEFLGNEFTHLEFLRRPGRKDLGKQMLYKDAYMTGWAMKTITYDDLKFPLVWGEGKRSRVLATIGVTRGFGDHELRAQLGQLPIKPFLTPEPEVRVLELAQDERLAAEDVLIMGSDGLWDVTSNEEAADIVRRSFNCFPDSEESRAKYRYITAAQDLIIHSRGHTSNWNNCWLTADDRLASLDDISAFVVPLKPYRDEYLEWKRLRSLAGGGAGLGSPSSKSNK